MTTLTSLSTAQNGDTAGQADHLPAVLTLPALEGWQALTPPQKARLAKRLLFSVHEEPAVRQLELQVVLSLVSPVRRPFVNEFILIVLGMDVKRRRYRRRISRRRP
jgi:hypothetical protein